MEVTRPARMVACVVIRLQMITNVRAPTATPEEIVKSVSISNICILLGHHVGFWVTISWIFYRPYNANCVMSVAQFVVYMMCGVLTSTKT